MKRILMTLLWTLVILIGILGISGLFDFLELRFPKIFFIVSSVFLLSMTFWLIYEINKE
ncbi:MAG: hypothetical protein PHP92_03845 [Candidatus Nanoarchaeia archaeon]|nr:hypothetical protein [Candidatus Nanoarchaeia archaeon]